MMAPSWRLSSLLCVVFSLAACGTGETDSSAAGGFTGTGQQAIVREAAYPSAPAGYDYVFRFAKISNGAYFFTGSQVERDLIIGTLADFRCEGVGFLQTTSSSIPNIPVFRFANLGNGGYFYTSSVGERDLVIQSRPDMRFEGSTFSVAQACLLYTSPSPRD